MERVEGFNLIVHHDDGVYRHITLRHPEHIYGSFSLVTWPGYISYNGDMGDYTFQRHHDMFSFFRRNKPEDTGISPDYWREKARAIDKHAGVFEYSPAKFDEAIKDQFEEYWEFDSEEQKEKAWEMIEWDLLRSPETLDRAYDLGCNYECPITKQTFVDFWETRLEEFTYHYIFCCRAVPWAIQKYDEYKAHSLHS